VEFPLGPNFRLWITMW